LPDERGQADPEDRQRKPEATWFASRVSVSTAKISAMSAPAAIPASVPTVALPEWWARANPAIAPTAIMPSAPGSAHRFLGDELARAR
jgi:hypothetical protein